MTKRNSLSLAELSRYAEDSGINDRVFDRVYLLRRYQETESFDYRDFVWFILSEEDKVTFLCYTFSFRIELEFLHSLALNQTPLAKLNVGKNIKTNQTLLARLNVANFRPYRRSI